MNYKTIEMGMNKKIALVAHDNKKRDLIEWAKYNRDLLAHHKVYATGTTGAVLEKELEVSHQAARERAARAATSRSARRSSTARSTS